MHFKNLIFSKQVSLCPKFRERRKIQSEVINTTGYGLNDTTPERSEGHGQLKIKL